MVLMSFACCHSNATVRLSSSFPPKTSQRSPEALDFTFATGTHVGSSKRGSEEFRNFASTQVLDPRLFECWSNGMAVEESLVMTRAERIVVRRICQLFRWLVYGGDQAMMQANAHVLIRSDSL
eukprot:scaffold1954_cov268-Pinguiococcus_pyrenoidosus.AAC.103